MKGAGIRLILSYKFATAVQHFLLLLQKKTQRWFAVWGPEDCEFPPGPS